MFEIETIEDAPITEENFEKIPTLNHSIICSRIMRQLLPNESIEVLPELTLAIENGLTPDISVFPSGQITPDFLEDVIRFEKSPIIAIEIVSPSQNIQELLRKSKKFIQSGVKNVWTIEPFTRTIFVTTANGTDILHDTIVESDGIKVDFAAIFNS